MVKKIFKKILSATGFEIKRIPQSTMYDKVVSIPNKEQRGHSLVSYVIEPFLSDGDSSLYNTHTHFGEAELIIEMLLEMGYSVDVVSFRNNTFIPQKKYDLFIGARTNFNRISSHLNSDCIKIAHMDVTHWLFNNTAAHKRALNLQTRRGVTIPLYRKMLEESTAIESCDYAVIMGNEHTASTYAFAKKKMFHVVVPSSLEYPWNDKKNFEKARNNYLWLGSHGPINRGVDLLLEAFASMPEYRLTLCGPLSDDPIFEKFYNQELYHTPNILTKGWVDIGSDEFYRITQDNIAIIYPSAADCQAGSVVTCMHAGLIPIVSYETGIVNAEQYGTVLYDCSIAEIKKSVITLSGFDEYELKSRSKKVWERARSFYTRSHYKMQYKKIIKEILQEQHIN
jgi:glycosyltransferase involved in cell wall biosynthesis